MNEKLAEDEELDAVIAYIDSFLESETCPLIPKHVENAIRVAMDLLINHLKHRHHRGRRGAN